MNSNTNSLCIFDLLFISHFNDEFYQFISRLFLNKEILIDKRIYTSSNYSNSINRNNNTNANTNLNTYTTPILYSLNDRFTNEFYIIDIRLFLNTTFYKHIILNTKKFDGNFHSNISEYFRKIQLDYRIIYKNSNSTNTILESTIDIYIKLNSKDENEDNISEFDKIIYFYCSYCNQYHICSRDILLRFFKTSNIHSHIHNDNKNNESTDNDDDDDDDDDDFSKNKNILLNIYNDTYLFNDFSCYKNKDYKESNYYESDDHDNESYSTDNETYDNLQFHFDDIKDNISKNNFVKNDDRDLVRNLIDSLEFFSLPYKCISQLQKYIIILCNLCCYIKENILERKQSTPTSIFSSRRNSNIQKIYFSFN